MSTPGVLAFNLQRKDLRQRLHPRHVDLPLLPIRAVVTLPCFQFCPSLRGTESRAAVGRTLRVYVSTTHSATYQLLKDRAHACHALAVRCLV